jgi:hypothetical protein
MVKAELRTRERLNTSVPRFANRRGAYGLATSHDLSFLVGGGLDVRAKPHWAIRVGQFDYIRSHVTPTEWQNNWRVSTELVFRY